MKRFTAALVLLISSLNAFATWSIIIIDPNTKEIGIAGASCTHNCYGIGEIVPGMGAIIVQAMSNADARQRGVELIVSDSSPEQIIAELKNPKFDPERQQYAVMTMKGLDNPLTYTGSLTNNYNGAATAKTISVQGNTLASDIEIKTIFDAAMKAQTEGLSVDAVLMRALEAGAQMGGDKRCGEQKATTAFIKIVKPGSRKPFLDLSIFGQRMGGQNAVTLLRKKYNKWKLKHP